MTAREAALGILALGMLGAGPGACDDERAPIAPDPNEPPLARLVADSTAGPAPLPVRFDAGESEDPDGEITAFEWELGDGTTASGPVVEHRYPEVGMYVVRLTVRDDEADHDVAKDSVFVLAAPGNGDHRIEGTVWHDVDADGSRDAGEPPVPGTEIYLDDDGDGELDDGEVVTVSLPDGGFAFRGLDGSRSYTVTQALTLGWTNTRPGAEASETNGVVLRSGRGAARIVEGREVEHADFPFMVALLRASESNRRDAFFCGGTLISGRWVLTAAHCVRDRDLAEFEVLVGTAELTEGGDRVGVVSKRVNPVFFNERTFENDIAVLELASRIMLPRIELMTPDRRELAERGDTATALGWGRTGPDDPVSTRLRAAELPVVKQSLCKGQYGPVGDELVCAGFDGGGPATCFGDSGGPLAVRGPAGRWIQVGITSFGFNCGQSLPSVFVRVSHHLDFIRDRTAPEPSGSYLVDWSTGAVATVRFGNFR